MVSNTPASSRDVKKKGEECLECVTNTVTGKSNMDERDAVKAQSFRPPLRGPEQWRIIMPDRQMSEEEDAELGKHQGNRAKYHNGSSALPFKVKDTCRDVRIKVQVRKCERIRQLMKCLDCF